MIDKIKRLWKWLMHNGWTIEDHPLGWVEPRQHQQFIPIERTPAAIKFAHEINKTMLTLKSLGLTEDYKCHS